MNGAPIDGKAVNLAFQPKKEKLSAIFKYHYSSGIYSVPLQISSSRLMMNKSGMGDWRSKIFIKNANSM
jgi:hypothetical protein